MSPSADNLHKAETISRDERAECESTVHHCRDLDCVHVKIDGKTYEWVVHEQELPKEWIQVLKELTIGETARLEGTQTFLDVPTPFQVELVKIVRGHKIDSHFVWIDRKTASNKKLKRSKLKPLSLLQIKITDKRSAPGGEEEASTNPTRVEEVLLGEADKKISTVLETTLYKMRVGETAKIIHSTHFLRPQDVKEEEMRIDIEVCNIRTEKKPSESSAVLKRAGELKEMGNKWLALGKFSKAIERYNVASEYLEDCKETEERKVRAAVLSNQALAHLKIGTKVDADSCVFCCDIVSGLQPPSVKIMFRRAQALEIMDNLDEAEWQYKEALKIEPENAAVISALNNMSRENKKRALIEKQTAAKAFSKPLGYYPSTTSTNEKSIKDTTDRYGNYVFQAQNEFDEDPSPPIDSPDLQKRVLAMEALLKKATGDKSHLWYDLGWLFQTMGENARAFPCFLKDAEKNLLELAVSGAALEDIEFGKQFLRQWALLPKSEDESDEEDDEKKTAMELKDLLLEAPSGMEREQALGIYYYYDMEFEKSAGHFAHGLKLATTDYHKELLWLRLGASLTNGKQCEEALICTSMSLFLNKYSPKAWENLSHALGHLGRQGEQKYALIQACKLYDKEEIAAQIYDIDAEPEEFDCRNYVKDAEPTVLKIMEQIN